MAPTMSAVGPLVNFGAFPAAYAEFRRGLRTNWNVVFAVMLRETRTRYGESALGYGWALIDPMIELIVLWGIYTLTGRQVPVDVPLPVFLVTGIVPFGLWRESVKRGASAIKSNIPLLIYPQVTVADLIIARVLLEGATTLIVMQIFIFALIVLYGETITDFYDEPFSLLMAWLTLLFLACGSSFLSAGLARIWPLWPTVFSYCSRPLWMTSGIFFTLGSLPSSFRRYAIDNPLAHLLEWIRSASLSQFESTYYSVPFILMSGIAIAFVGLLMDQALRWVGHVESKS